VSVTKGHRKAGALAALGAATVAAVATAAVPPVAVKATSRNEKMPASDGLWLAWAESRATTPSPFDVWAQRGETAPWKVNPAGTQGYAGGVDAGRLAYQQIRGATADIRLYDLERKQQLRLPSGVNTRRRECCATLTGDWLLFTRGAPKVTTTQLVVLTNLRSGRIRVLDSLRSRRGVLTTGQVSESHAVWLKCNPHPRCRIVRYELSGGRTSVVPTGTNVYAPSVSDLGTVFYARRTAGCGQTVQIVRQPQVGPAEVLASLPSGEDVSSTYADAPVPKDLAMPAWVFFAKFKCQGGRSDVYKVREGVIIHASGRR
jgi:hypothetical protein